MEHVYALRKELASLKYLDKKSYEAKYITKADPVVFDNADNLLMKCKFDDLLNDFDIFPSFHGTICLEAINNEYACTVEIGDKFITYATQSFGISSAITGRGYATDNKFVEEVYLDLQRLIQLYK